MKKNTKNLPKWAAKAFNALGAAISTSVAMFAVAAIATGCATDPPGSGRGPVLPTNPDAIELDFTDDNNGEYITQLSYDNIGGEEFVSVWCNYDWTVRVVDEAGNQVDWAEMDVDSGRSKQTVGATLIVAVNETADDRTAYIVFTSGNFQAGKKITITQEASMLNVSASKVTLTHVAMDFRDVTVESNFPDGWSYTVEPAESWLQVSQKPTGLTIYAATANESENEADKKTGKVIITAGTMSHTIDVTQDIKRDFYTDGHVVQLQEASKGNGIDLILMGDGYVQKDMIPTSGLYERDLTLAAEHFFSVYPYNAYREYFNVWMVVAISNQAGVSLGDNQYRPTTKVDTKFGVTWEGSGSTGLRCFGGRVIEYAQKAIGNDTADLNKSTVIMPVNANIYAGTCYMPPEGFAYAMCPTGNQYGPDQYRKLVVHEVGGHGFGKLMDEYIYNNAPLPADLRAGILAGKKVGFFRNVDMNIEAGDNIAAAGVYDYEDTIWEQFRGVDGYGLEQEEGESNSAYNSRYLKTYGVVGAWEGSYMYSRGIWRPERNSCMNNNVLYFNAPSRYAQMERIFEWSGVDTDYTFEEFLRDDIRPPYDYDSDMDYKPGTRWASAPPLAPPVLGWE